MHFSFVHLIPAGLILPYLASAVASSSGIGIIYNILLLIFLQRFKIKIKTKHLRLIVAFIFTLLFSAIWATIDSYTFYKFMMLIFKILPISILGYIASRNSELFYRSFRLQLFVTFCVILLLGYANGLTFDINNRLEIGTINPIWVSRILCITILAIYFDHRVFAVFLSFIALPIILMAGSKGPVLALLVCILIWEKINWKLLLCFLLITSFFAFIMFKYIDDTVLTYLVQRFLRVVPDGSEVTLTRPYIFTHGLTQFSVQNIPTILFGLGLGDSGELFKLTGRFYPHNLPLEMLFEIGALPTVILSMLLIKVFYNHYSIRAKILFVFFVMNACFSGDIITNELLFFFIFFFDRKAHANTA